MLNSSDPLRPSTPYCSLLDHTLSVTSIAVGLGRFPNIRVLTGSQDGSCKVSARNRFWSIDFADSYHLTPFLDLGSVPTCTASPHHF
jgi:hypothetical protein